jgi:ribonucleotide monophosphatase NagD (HAD superfamily)
LLGEPKQWEMCLQLLVDLLLTDGLPAESARRHHHQTLPVIVCNTDMQFMHRAAFPRFGHGAFVLCLEALFKVNPIAYNTV